jgi:ribose 5-phosphate isomerase B
MKIAVTSDEIYPIHKYVIDWLERAGHEIMLFGALKSGNDNLG